MAATENNIPDSRGLNAFASDPAFDALLDIYLPEDLQDRLRPELDRMGGLVGDRLEELALAADHNPPELKLRDRTGQRSETIEKHPAYEELERYAFSEFGLAAMSHRAGVFGAETKLHPMAKYALVYLFVQAEFGLCCPLDDRQPDTNAGQVRRSRLGRTLHRSSHEPGHGHAFSRRDVHDRAGGGLRCRGDRDRRATAGWRVAPLRGQVVLLEPRRGSGDGARAA